ncbi:MAG: protein-export chaperone SecB [Magnetococcales bacterium]|nr:protein-export chaperone SecB [Magnetococcales bacterium]NGZ27331.1 protein-export chaperone SecB [Magnetococcales bacterium]
MSEAEDNQPFFHVEKIYLKDLSFESPYTPESFFINEEPKVDFNLETTNVRRGQDIYESSIQITVKVHTDEKVWFLVEVTYAGIFRMRNIPEDRMAMLLGIECPTILFPYVRQIVSQTITEGGFKPLLLDPINFAAVYQQNQMRRQQQGEANPLVN